ncbi:hypothetical protein PHYBLDRAFT_165575 [Phycomyces blakesleeanus NRRL 1555(-)]|uniref:Uncharacterized protein n=1 Tax=Phycomyces blakesleeanus (strain ATCC 8743b / DSM 1359 / FGSC 10004 / NBRC 33097 / NRRL 1555) TaxID=763407 RepID=A0A167P1S5_PHYB8|nr:hypothetical protein PHYBLDRAFT_165575 [Phycomyces blakesleeanus NRRL 1555(-)]OAD77081.1 hypothetical protein PHYBLDRAFT_165575 [Phycomyces blakesleeanus NRRL 1555(-)]|eukprot:XP_018295121.1 hypothetical protein PHYBLDRAFT_165575 [Phycomyces blakesleeanus NRRL 1555(-)]
MLLVLKLWSISFYYIQLVNWVFVVCYCEMHLHIIFFGIGHHVAVYLCTLHDDGFYVVFEVGDIKVPKSILELPGFIMKLDGIKQLANLYEYSCARKDDETVISKPKILSPNNTEMSTIINTRITFFIR